MPAYSGPFFTGQRHKPWFYAELPEGLMTADNNLRDA
jgi:hypothetical protein